MKILVVDDEYIELLTIKKMLHEQGYDAVKTAENGFEALKLLQSESFDSILLDISMPGLSGLELLEIINRKWSDVVVSIVSAYGEFTYAQKALELGAHCYLLKPFSTSELTDTLKRLKSQYDKKVHMKGMIKQSFMESVIYAQEQSVSLTELIAVFGFSPEVIIATKSFQQNWEKQFPTFFKEINDIAIFKQINGFSLVVTKKENLKQVKEKLLSVQVHFGDAFLYGIGCSQDIKVAYGKAIQDLTDKNTTIATKSTLYIRENYSKQLTLENVANAVHVSSSHLNRLLKKETGKTFTEILLSTRIYKSQILLKQNYNIDFVSDKVGFNSSAYFAVCFKKVTGLSPSEYRRDVW